MFDTQIGHASVRPARRETTFPSPALSAGTIVLTLEGALPVEFLSAGDRIITRAGARVLQAIDTQPGPAEPSFRLRFDAPEVIYADGMEVATAPLG